MNRMNFVFFRTLKYAFRFLLRAKSYTIINLVGLAFSLACCIILLRYIHRELTVDTHCIDSEHVIVPLRDADGNIFPSSTEYADTAYIKQEQIVERCRVVSQGKDNIVYQDKNYEVKVMGVDSLFFHFFHYTLQKGTIDLHDPASVLISEKCARRLFGKENPIGKYLQHNYQTVVVKGVLDEPSCKSTLDFDLLFPFHHQKNWTRMTMELLRVLPGVDLDKINAVSNVYREDNMGYSFRYRFIPWKQLYFDSSVADADLEGVRHGNRSYLTILSGVVFLLLAVGVLNFLNLYMVVMMKRSKEYGIKKVFGLSRIPLFIEIWLENFLLVLAALLGAWLVIEVTAGAVERLMGERLAYTPFDLWLSLGIVFILPLLTVVYPYVRHAYCSPLSSIKQIAATPHSVRFRLVFLFFQYGIAMLLMMLSLYFKHHFDFLITTPPGYRTERILEADLHHENQNWNETQEQRENRWNRIGRISQALNECPYIDFWMYSHANILKGSSYCNIVNDKNQVISMPVYFVAPEFFKLYELKVSEGKIPEEIATMNESQMVLNESAMQAFGYAHKEEAFVRGESPLWISVTDGQVTQGGTALMPVVSVIKDFYAGHLKDGTKPMAFIVTNKNSQGKALMSVKEGKEKELLSYLRKVEKDVYNTEEFTYSWFADNVASLYAHDRKITIIYSTFAFIAIVISCLGLFGISLFDIRQRYREIAIRKVNGAGRRDLYRLLCGKYLKVLVAAFLFSAPLAWYIIYCYTSGFVVKAPVSADIFLLSLLVVVIISLGTLAWQVNKAVKINPARIMKNE